MDDEPEELGAKRDRSPIVPYLGLTQSIDLARKLYQVARSSEVRLAQIAPHWNTTATSGALARYAGALQGYGLIESSGSKESRKIRITEDGRRILEDNRPGVSEALKSKAAIKPKMFELLFEIWGRTRPTDDIARSALQFDYNFTAIAAKRFLTVFDEAVSYVSGDPISTTSASVASEELRQPSSSPTEIVVTGAAPTSDRSNLAPSSGDFGNLTRRDVFALEEGEVVLIAPKTLSRASFEDLSEWLALVARKIERSVVDD